ncbi:MAG TPA: GNAT family N-acetyltransferase [Caldithrix abyssi]|uniref:GNAT family N-acetyltransferase n=1 Tax=Caldithrix abyssi TaxID=187145 RepID=A0A7V5RNR7_CALAY|nr:GNAT family N-acetyltransferase [Caldithrix abyssi]
MRIVKKLRELEELKDSWLELETNMNNPLIGWDWMSSCARAFCREEELFVLAEEDDGVITAIAPLFIHEENGFRKLEILGTPALGEPGGLLYKDREALQKLLQSLLKQGLPISLRRLPKESEELSLIQQVFHYHSLHSLREGGGCPWIPVDSDWETFEQSLSSRRKSDMRRARRRAEKLGVVAIRIHDVAEKDVEPLLEDVFRVEAANWKGRNGSSLLHRRDLARFYMIYSQKAARKGTLRVGTLTIDNTVIAVLLGLREAQRFWVFKIGYDEEYARCSPGVLLMHGAIEYAFKEKLSSFEFLGWDAKWMHVWTDKVRRYKSPLIYPFSARGLKGFALDSAYYIKNKILAEYGNGN